MALNTVVFIQDNIMHLLTLKQLKMEKSAKFGYLSACLNLEPAFRYKGNQTCPWRGKCAATCLKSSGHNRFATANASRLRKTKLYYDDKALFYAMLRGDLSALIAKAKREKVIPTCRLNTLSDIPFEDDVVADGQNIFQLYPEVLFNDYTKSTERMFKKHTRNYHLTYSINEKTPHGVVERIYRDTPYNCAQVFANSLPTEFSMDDQLYGVYSGDEHDVRSLDPRGMIIGLVYKRAFVVNGKAFKPKKSNAFIILEEHGQTN